MCRKTEVCTVQYTIKPHLPAFFCFRENRSAMGWMPTGTTFSYSLRSKYADLVE